MGGDLALFCRFYSRFAFSRPLSFFADNRDRFLNRVDLDMGGYSGERPFGRGQEDDSFWRMEHKAPFDQCNEMHELDAGR